MAKQAALSTPEAIRRAAYAAIDAADAMEIQSYSLTRVEMLIGEVEQAAMDMRVAVRGPGAASA